MEYYDNETERWFVTLGCGHEYGYTNKYNARKAEKDGKNCVSCTRLPENNPMFGKTGDKNPMFGVKHTEEARKKISNKARSRVYTEEQKEQAKSQLSKVTNKRPLYDIWVEKYGKDEADKRNSELSKKKSINSTGKNNPMYGKPAPQGSGVGWKGWIDGSFFRSLRELQFILNNPDCISAETKFWTAEYTDYTGSARTTRPDFVDNSAKIVYECKPLRLRSTTSVIDKANALTTLCLSRGYTYRLIDPGIPELDILIKLTEEEKIVWQGNYKERLYEWQKSTLQEGYQDLQRLRGPRRS